MNQNLKLEQLRTFRVVAEQGALAEAAAVLGRTPSALSMTLAQLEERLGAPLFETDRKNRLTRLGERVLDEAVRITDAFDRGAEAIARLTASAAGTVRIAAVPSAAVTLLPGLVAAFRGRHPGLRFEISDLDSAAVERMVRRDEADIGLATAGEATSRDSPLLLRDALGIAFRRGGAIERALQNGAAASWELLKAEPLIANPLAALVPHPVVAGAVVEARLMARNTTTLLALVREGLGATILPARALSEAGEGLGFVCPADPPATRALSLLRTPGRRLAPAAAEVWDLLLSQAEGRATVPGGEKP